MSYLGRSASKRREVRAAEPTAQSVIVTATVYNTDRPHAIDATDPRRAVISRYAWGDDYHVIVRQRLDALAEWMRVEHGEPFEARAYVDTGPMQERVYAQYAGLGWIGKNSCLINPELGSWLFLGCLITSLPLEADAPGFDQCGECTRVPFCLSHRRHRRAGHARCDAVHLVPDHRAAQGAAERAACRRWARSSTGATSARTSALESPRRGVGRAGVGAAAGLADARVAGACGAGATTSWRG